MAERYFYVSYSLVSKNNEAGFGSAWLNLLGDKVTRQTLEDWKEFLINNDESLESVIILFFHELEEE